MIVPPFHQRLFKQRRFQKLLVILASLAIFIGIMIVPIEARSGERSINTIFDGLWWTITTITGVGYGDYVPITKTGRMLGMVLMLLGAVFFGSLIGMVQVYLSRSKDEYYWKRMFDELDKIENELAVVKKQVEFMLKDEKKDV